MTVEHRNGSAPLERLSDSLFSEFMEKIPAMHAEMERLEDQRTALIQKHQEQLGEIDEQKKKLRALLRALGEDEPAPRRKQTPAASGKQVSDKLLLKLLGGILEYGDGELFMALDVHDRVADWQPPSTYLGFDYLRSLEIIGKAGKGDGNRDLWRIMPGGRDIAFQLREALGEKNPAPATPRPPQPATAPTEPFLKRVTDAIEQLGTPEFTALAVNDVLGLSSPRNTYSAMKYLRQIGYVEEMGKDKDGPHGKTLYRIKDATVLDQQLNLEATNA